MHELRQNEVSFLGVSGGTTWACGLQTSEHLCPLQRGEQVRSCLGELTAWCTESSGALREALEGSLTFFQLTCGETVPGVHAVFLSVSKHIVREHTPHALPAESSKCARCLSSGLQGRRTSLREMTTAEDQAGGI